MVQEQKQALLLFLSPAFVLLSGILTMRQCSKISLRIILMIVVLMVNINMPRKFTVPVLIVLAGFVDRSCFSLGLNNVNLSTLMLFGLCLRLL